MASKKPIRIGRFEKGGGLKAVTIEADKELEFVFDLSKAGAELRDKMAAWARNQATTVEKQPSAATIERRGPGRMWNVTGKLARITAVLVEGGWNLVAGRKIPKGAARRFMADAKINAQRAFKDKELQQELLKLPRKFIREIKPK